jgi:LPS export ABC transporter protein LptC
MASWQRRARAGVAIFGLAVAVFVLFAMRHRDTAAPPAAVQRIDPKSILETISTSVERVTGIEKNFEVLSKSVRTYADGSTKLEGDVTVIVRKGDNRTFKVVAREAQSGKDQANLALSGDVKLEDSDGFFLTTDQATYHGSASTANAPGAVIFGKGRMSGSGTGITYDQAHDVLNVSSQAHITTKDEAGNVVMEFTAGTATLDRVQHLLTLDTAVHVMRGEQVIEADHAVGRLGPNDDVITFIELRGNSRVEGGNSAIDAMSARDINLDYSDDGMSLEAVALNGSAAVALTGQNGSSQQQIVSEVIDIALAPDGSKHVVMNGHAIVTMPGAKGRGAQTIGGETLELDLATDGALTRTVGRENVRLDLPAAEDAPARSIRSKLLDGHGAAGKGLTNATFTGDVTFTEQVAKAAGRTARAQKLEASLADDAVTAATFTGDATFEETGLKACAARMDYQPVKGTLALSGATAAGNPRVGEEQITIEGQTIDVTLDSRRMVAKGAVRTLMRTQTPCKPAVARTAADQGSMRMPGLLEADTPATLTSATLDYQGESGRAVYAGGPNAKAALSQGSTAIHADTIAIDQQNGDLTATGSAVSTMVLDGETSTARAHEIRYVDAKRLITYAAKPPPPATPGVVAPAAGSVGAPAPPVAPPTGAAPAAAAGAPTGRGAVLPVLPPPPEAQLSGPQGDLRAGRIDIVLAKEGSAAERIEAFTNVRMTQGFRTVSEGARMTYYSDEEKYVMTAGPSLPVKLVERQGGACREFSGRSLTLYKSNDTIFIDGQKQNRTQTAPSACTVR